MVYLDEHSDWIEYDAFEAPNVGPRIKLTRIKKHNTAQWKELLIKNFAKISITCKCSDKPPLCVKLELEGPWTSNG